jgi:hypothetical protein
MSNSPVLGIKIDNVFLLEIKCAKLFGMESGREYWVN